LQIPTDGWADYDWKGRTIKYHRAAIRGTLGFRESTAGDSEAMMGWGDRALLPHERDVERINTEDGNARVEPSKTNGSRA
jgi:hypothetical protein